VLFSSGLAHVRANDVSFLYRLRHRSLSAPQTSGPCQNHRASALRGCVNRVIGRTRGRRLWNRAERSGVGFVGAPQSGAFFLEFHGDIAMKKLIAATAAVLPLGIATSEVAHAQTPRSTTAMPPQSTQSETAVPESQVKQAQQQLKSAGLYKGTVDGKMGTDTQQAIEQFQQQHGLVATGTLDEQTMAALQGRAGSSASPLTPSGQPSSTGR